MNLHLQHKNIIVTGGAKGIGAAIVHTLVAEGAFPIIIGRNADDNEKMLKEINEKGGNGFAFAIELNDQTDYSSLKNAIKEKVNQIHGIINNAGANDGVGLAKGNIPQFIESIHKNVTHYYAITQTFLSDLIETKGSIVNISSKVAETGQGSTSGYAAANGARNALTREWALELLPYQIRVNAVIVAESSTPLYQDWIQTQLNPEDTLKKIESIIPLGNRMTTPQEIANMVVFLLSDVSSHTTGQLIHVDGGYVHLDRAIKK